MKMIDRSQGTEAVESYPPSPNTNTQH